MAMVRVHDSSLLQVDTLHSLDGFEQTTQVDMQVTGRRCEEAKDGLDRLRS